MQIYLLSSFNHTHTHTQMAIHSLLKVHKYLALSKTDAYTCYHQSYTNKCQYIYYSKCINTMHYQRLMKILVIINHTQNDNTMHNQRLMHILVIINHTHTQMAIPSLLKVHKYRALSKTDAYTCYHQSHTHKWQTIRYSKCINTLHYQRLMHILVIINQTHTHRNGNPFTTQSA